MATIATPLVQQICKDSKDSNSCESASMELGILIDSSGSVGSRNFEKLKNWTVDLIEKLQIKEYGTRVGVVKYETRVLDIMPLSSDVLELTMKITELRWTRGKTNTGAALEYLRTHTFASNRPGVNNSFALGALCGIDYAADVYRFIFILYLNPKINRNIIHKFGSKIEILGKNRNFG